MSREGGGREGRREDAREKSEGERERERERMRTGDRDPLCRRRVSHGYRGDLSSDQYPGVARSRAESRAGVAAEDRRPTGGLRHIREDTERGSKED